jgi:hypothetical protein
VKAISLHQPWASMVARGIKDIETRKWHTEYRGKLLICSTKKPVLPNYPLGMALCIVEITHCRPMLLIDQERACCPWRHDLFSWFLTHRLPIKYFPIIGRQRFYEVELPDEVSSTLFKQ